MSTMTHRNGGDLLNVLVEKVGIIILLNAHYETSKRWRFIKCVCRKSGNLLKVMSAVKIKY